MPICCANLLWASSYLVISWSWEPIFRKMTCPMPSKNNCTLEDPECPRLSQIWTIYAQIPSPHISGFLIFDPNITHHLESRQPWICPAPILLPSTTEHRTKSTWLWSVKKLPWEKSPSGNQTFQAGKSTRNGGFNKGKSPVLVYLALPRLIAEGYLLTLLWAGHPCWYHFCSSWSVLLVQEPSFFHSLLYKQITVSCTAKMWKKGSSLIMRLEYYWDLEPLKWVRGILQPLEGISCWNPSVWATTWARPFRALPNRLSWSKLHEGYLVISPAVFLQMRIRCYMAAKVRSISQVVFWL